MTETEALVRERKVAIMQLKQGKSEGEVAQNLGRSVGWVCKWQQRFKAKGWKGLASQSRAPKQPGNKTAEAVRVAIIQARLELEAEAALGEGLKYIGGPAVRTRLKKNKVAPLPSVPTIERVLREAGMTRTKAKAVESKVSYPHLCPTKPQQLYQLDIVPHFLQGGQRVACYNAIDVVSRYSTGLPFGQRRAADAVAFLVHVWQEMGVPTYTQVDNEGCFSGGATHPYVLGQVVRLALTVGTELVFSPTYHPESNGYIERFHQDYNRHVWEDTYLSDLAAVEQKGRQFFTLYRQREDHRQLHGHTPAMLHQREPRRELATGLQWPTTKLPLREGRIHFMRQVSPEGTVRVLNVNWSVPRFDPHKGVWVTLEFQTNGAILSIFDAAPDVAERHCLATYPFPLHEPLWPFAHPGPLETEAAPAAFTQPDTSVKQDPAMIVQAVTPQVAGLTRQPNPVLPVSAPLWSQLPTYQSVNQAGERVILSTLSYTARFTRYVFNTMF
jgi:transposase InsO family protein